MKLHFSPRFGLLTKRIDAMEISPLSSLIDIKLPNLEGINLKKVNTSSVLPVCYQSRGCSLQMLHTLGRQPTPFILRMPNVKVNFMFYSLFPGNK